VEKPEANDMFSLGFSEQDEFGARNPILEEQKGILEDYPAIGHAQKAELQGWGMG